MNTEQLLEKLTAAVSFAYKKDYTSPGVNVSFLKNKKYYSSVLRYTSAFAGGKEVVCSFIADTIHDALMGLSKAFVTTYKEEINPVAELQQSLAR